MTRKTRNAIVLLVLLCVAVPIAVDWLWTSDEERVESALAELEAALEARDGGRAAEGFAPDVAVEQPIPYFPSGPPLAEALATVLAKLTRLSLDRDETQIAFPEAGIAEVTTSGTGNVEMPALGAGHWPFRFELRLRLHRDPDDRFRLQTVESVTISSLFG